MAIIKIYPDKDAWVDDYYPNNNYGGLGYLSIGNCIGITRWWSFIRIPTYRLGSGATIQNVKLKINVYGFYEPNLKTERIHRVIADWEEMVITWNNKPSVSDLIVTTSISGLGWYECDITTAFINWHKGIWPNYGIRWKYTTESSELDDEIYFYSKDTVEEPTLKLYAEVEYTPGKQNYAFIM